MMILTAKVNPKKLLVILLSAVAVITALVLGLRSRSEDAAATSAMGSNDSRVRFLQEFGWEVTPVPKESSQVKIPEESGQMFQRYNALQKGQGYDLSKYAGKKVMRYVYEIRNFPGAEAPVYATLLVYKNKIIGGDITDTAVKGKIRGFQKPVAPPPTSEPNDGE